jgi:hypothetical protein
MLARAADARHHCGPFPDGAEAADEVVCPYLDIVGRNRASVRDTCGVGAAGVEMRLCGIAPPDLARYRRACRSALRRRYGRASLIGKRDRWAEHDDIA